MRIYIDSADITDIKEALASGFVYGVTTNPSLIHKSGRDFLAISFAVATQRYAFVVTNSTRKFSSVVSGKCRR